MTGPRSSFPCPACRREGRDHSETSLLMAVFHLHDAHGLPISRETAAQIEVEAGRADKTDRANPDSLTSV